MSARVKIQRALLLCGFPLLVLLGGCSGYILRIVVQSVERIGERIPDPPKMITTPILPDPGLAVGWVGHATMLLQIHDKVIMTDPFLTNTIGMLAMRSVKPALDPALLTRVDATLVSHIHFDHFNYGSLDLLPKNGILTLPYGALQYTPAFGFAKTVELKPWESVAWEGMTITAVPAQHFTGRYGFDAAWLGTTGYTGYVLEYRGETIFFAGDTGYNPEFFKEIGRRFKIDLALIPIAPSSSNGLGSRVHTNPRGALQIFKDLGAKWMIPMHYATLFYGPSTNPTGPADQLRVLAKEDGLSDRVFILGIGDQHVFP